MTTEHLPQTGEDLHGQDLAPSTFEPVAHGMGSSEAAPHPARSVTPHESPVESLPHQIKQSDILQRSQTHGFNWEKSE